MKDNKRPWNETEGKPYSVTIWYDVPGESDSCVTGCDFATEKEARQCLADMGAYFNTSYLTHAPYILLDGPDLHELITRKAQLERCVREREAADRMARSEAAMQAGMGGGIAAYNEALGYDSEPYDPAIHDNDDARARREQEEQ